MTDWMPEPEPTLQPSAQALPDVDFHLWRDAPAWRNLVLSAIALTAGLLALPLVATAPEVEGQATQDMGACQVNATSFSGAWQRRRRWLPKHGSGAKAHAKHAIYVAPRD
ncbi:MAG: hypothetical protein WCA26_10015 [Xanthobacteraceae bacterium]